MAWLSRMSPLVKKAFISLDDTWLKCTESGICSAEKA